MDLFCTMGRQMKASRGIFFMEMALEMVLLLIFSKVINIMEARPHEFITICCMELIKCRNERNQYRECYLQS